MPSDIVPAEAEIVAVVRIDTYPQQFAFDAWTGEAAGGVLIVTIGEIPEKIVAVAIDKRQFFFRQRIHALCREGFIVV